ncbi:MAG: MarR family transcriptional regulator [Lachnospirales bacterium]
MNIEEQVMEGFWDLFNKRNLLNGARMKTELSDYYPSEVHCAEYIGENVDSNVTQLAESFYMTKSAISKLTKKMINKGLIESYQKSNNKKEIYFRLTAQGEKIYKIHAELHKEHQERDKAVFEQVTKEQYEAMLRFTEIYNRHLDAEIEKMGIDIKSGGLDRL